MAANKKTGTTEPVSIGGGVIALVAAVLPVLVLFGVDLTEAQIAGIQGVVVAVVALVTLVLRGKVTPDIKVAERVNAKAEVVAGPANDIVDEGVVVRKQGEPAGEAGKDRPL